MSKRIRSNRGKESALFVERLETRTFLSAAIEPLQLNMLGSSGSTTDDSAALLAGGSLALESAASYQWGTINSPKQSGVPFNVSITARDGSGNVATGFNGSVTLTGRSSTTVATGETMLGDVTPDTTVFVLARTLGYSFTPTSDVIVTHLRSFFGSKISIWTNDGTLLRSVGITAPGGTWTETALDVPLRLFAGVTYRIGAFNGGHTYYGRKDLPANNAIGTINEAFFSVGDAVPTTPDNVEWWLVDLKGNRHSVDTVPVTPSVATFTNGVFNGNISVNPLATDMVIRADDGAGHIADSNSFVVVAGPAASIEWSTVSTPQQSGVPFGTTLTARDAAGHLADGFNGSANLNALSTTIVPGLSMLGNVTPDTEVFVLSRTLGYSFTPSNDVIVTHMRSYFGNRVSIWKEDGTLLATQFVTAPGGVWTETPLDVPLRLTAGATYRIGAYNAARRYYGKKNQPSNNALGTINQSFYSVGDQMPQTVDNVNWWLVDLKGDRLDVTTVAVSPTPVNFTNGVFTGNVTVNPLATDLVLRADAGSGRIALSNSFVVVPGPASIFEWGPVSTPQTNGVPFSASLTARDTNGHLATGFNGNVNLSGIASTTVGPGENMLGTPTPDTTVYASSRTLGYSFTPSSDVIVTHVRSFFGVKVSIWANDGTLLRSQGVSAPGGSWTETALDVPIRLKAGVTYRIGAFNGGFVYYGRKGLPATNSIGTINQAFFAVVDEMPKLADTVNWWLVDLKGDRQSIDPAPVTPSVASFTNGLWSGNITINQTATEFVLKADDGLGHISTSGAFVVVDPVPLIAPKVASKPPTRRTAARPATDIF